MNSENSRRLCADEIERYHKEGFVGPYRLCSVEEMERLYRRIKSEVFRSNDPTPVYDTYGRHRDSRLVYDLCASAEIVERFASLYGPDILLWNSDLWIKKRGDRIVPWHQDFHYWSMTPPLNFTAWLAVTPATVDTGCLAVIPGSHLDFIPHVEAKSVLFDKMADPKYVDESKAHDLVLEPGQFVLFNDRLLHRSGLNRSNLPRVGLVARFTVPFVKIAKKTEEAPDLPKSYVVSGVDRFGFNDTAEPPHSIVPVS